MCALDLGDRLGHRLAVGFGQEQLGEDGGGEGQHTEGDDHGQLAVRVHLQYCISGGRRRTNQPEGDVGGGDGSDAGNRRTAANGTVPDYGREQLRGVGVHGCVGDGNGSLGDGHLNDGEVEGDAISDDPVGNETEAGGEQAGGYQLAAADPVDQEVDEEEGGDLHGGTQSKVQEETPASDVALHRQPVIHHGADRPVEVL